MTAPDLQLTATGSITGTATLAGQTTGNLGILVYVAGTSYVAFTRDDGKFTITGVPVATNYLVVASFDGYANSSPLTVDVTAGTATALATINLVKTVVPATVGSVTGTATLSDKSAGALAGIFVYLNGSSALAMTDSNGLFSLAGVPPGSYTLWAEKSGYDAVSTAVVVAAGANTSAGTVALTLSAPLAGSAKAITGFTFANATPISVSINESLHTVTVIVPPATDVTTLVPVVTQTGANLSPPSNWQQDFSVPVVYTVTATNGATQAYQVTVRKPQVTYDGQGATIGAIPSVQTRTGPSSTVVALPVAPLKVRYYCAGWTTAPSGGGLPFMSTSQVTGDMTVYANWVPSGSVWTPRTLPSSSSWFSITYGNGVFVAVASGGTSAATSPDGVNWTARTLPVTANWYSFTHGNGVFVALANGSNTAATSPDGVTWTVRPLPVLANWVSVAYGDGLFVAFASNSIFAATSPDGVTWTSRTLPGLANWRTVTHGNGVFVATVGGGIVAATSSDGITWTERILPLSTGWNSVTYGNGVFVTVGNGSSAVTSF